MNTVKYNTTEGFPLDTTNLDFLQNSLKITQAFGELAGDMSIIKGCIETGNQVSDGFIYLNGELFEFRGGTKSTYVIIRESEELAEFENGENKVIEVTRWLQFGNASERYKWADFKRPKNLQQLLELVETESRHNIPEGIIVMWSGLISNIPKGWALCNGFGGTPDLTDRFILGTSIQSKMHETGGEEKVSLAVDELPAHSHSATIGSGGAHQHNFDNAYMLEDNSATVGRRLYGNKKVVAGGDYFGSGRTDSDNNTILYYRDNTDEAGSHSHSAEISNTGEGKSHNNMPPYYSLAFIQYKGEQNGGLIEIK